MKLLDFIKFIKIKEISYEKDIELSVFKMSNLSHIDKRPIDLAIKKSQFYDLPEEIIRNILSLTSSNGLLNLRKCGRYFQRGITMFMIKRKMLENSYKFNLLRQADDEFYRDIKLNYNNHIKYNHIKYNHIDKPTNEYE